MTTRPGDGPRSRVCRRLFQDEDDEPREIGENRENKLMEHLHRQHIESFTAKYNFDPRTETPLEGNFEWYRRRTNGEWEKMPVRGDTETEQEEVPGDVNPDSREAALPENGDPAPEDSRDCPSGGS